MILWPLPQLRRRRLLRHRSTRTRRGRRSRSVRVHPADNPVIVGWKSPIYGQVRISGLVRDMDGHCGDGVSWSIDLGAWTLALGDIGHGEAQGFADAQGGPGLQSVLVSKGEFLYFVVDPNGEIGCDSTELEIRIESDACAAP